MTILDVARRPARHAVHGPLPWHPSGRAAGRAHLVLRDESGGTLALDTAHWHGTATTEEEALLGGVRGPVIDLGCGPGRLVLSLARRGVPALGIDSSPSAVDIARGRGAAVLERDLFGRLPGEGRWATVLLFDGNVGIGGDPVRLLGRCRRLTGGTGRVVVEVGTPGTGHRRVTAWVERDGHRSSAFPWSLVGADAVGALARRAGLAPFMVNETPSGRWFAHLEAAA